MQEEVNQKVVGLCISGGKISARILKNAIIKALKAMEKLDGEARRSLQARQARAKAEKEEGYRGKISIGKLKKENKELSNIEITDQNIKSFEKYARKYEVEYSLKKDKSVNPPRYFVFFGAKDVDSITAAFKEYTGWTLKKQKKASVRRKLEQAVGRVTKHREREKDRHKDRGPEH